jgi:hypothetical protein
MMRKVWAIAAALLAMALMFPVGATASAQLGGYAATAQASVVRIEVFDPTIPIPASPEVDVGVGFTRSTTLTGPSSRALASYLWPGDAIGDGISALTGTNLDYPVKVNSRYPATSTAPPKNTAQITDGNGMTTSANASTVIATVNGASVSTADPAGNPGAGLCALFGQKCPSLPTSPAPIAVPAAIAGAATMDALRSQTGVQITSSQVTATAHASATDLKVLGGLITIAGVDVTTSATSDASHSTTSGTFNITGLEIAGQKIDLSNPTIIGTKSIPIPDLPQPLSSIGVKIQYLQHQGSTGSGGGSLDAQGLTITVDTHPLVNALHLSTVTGPLANILQQIPTIGTQAAALLSLAPKIVVVVGDSEASTSANGQYVGSTVPTGTPTSSAQPGGQSGFPPSGSIPTTISTGGSPTGPAPLVAGVRPLAATLPALGGVPATLVLGGLALAVAVGWGLRMLGATVIGGAGRCSYGLASDLPDLRKG